MDDKAANDHLLLWNQASIKVLDIRHKIMNVGEELRSYRLPASGFLYAIRGNARLVVDGEVYSSERFHMLHSGKGACLDIILIEKEFEYYLIFYKAVISLPCRQNILSLMESNSPFHMRYGFSPHYPITLLDIIEKMHREWQQSGLIERFHVKMLFYQFVYENMRQMHNQETHIHKPVIADQVTRYIQECYSQPITLESVAQMLNYSVPYIAKQFKRKTGRSLIDYLIHTRIERAQDLLLITDTTLQEIASSVGYEDLSYFVRIFKKYSGVTPGQFKMQHPDKFKGSDCPTNRLILSNDRRELWSYSCIEDDNHYQYDEKGDLPMYKNTKSSMVATLFLCISLLLSACGAGTGMTTNTATNGNSSNSNAQQTAAATQSTKTVTTIFGEVEIPTKPQRIVAIQYLSSLLALDITPIGSTERTMESPYFEGMTAGISVIGKSADDVSFEKIMDLEPDLIILMTSEEEEYKTYSKIAPTVSIPYGALENAQKEVGFFGELLGREKEAETWIAEYEARVSAARAKVEQAVPSDATFSVLQDTDKTLTVFGNNFGRGGQPIYQELGRKAPEEYEAEIMEERYRPLSIEVLADYAGDYIILTSEKTLEDYKAYPIWSTLDAVKNNRMYIWSEKRSYFIDPLSLLAQTEELADWLSEGK